MRIRRFVWRLQKIKSLRRIWVDHESRRRKIKGYVFRIGVEKSLRVIIAIRTVKLRLKPRIDLTNIRLKKLRRREGHSDWREQKWRIKRKSLKKRKKKEDSWKVCW